MPNREHFYWIDWMKVIGIYFIIAGHMFSSGSDYLYAFSVPLFFAVSGFLSHHEVEGRIFWTKLFRNLIVPCFLICLIVLAAEVIIRVFYHKLDWTLIPMRLYNILIGNQGKGVKGGGLGMCWFIYTLVLCKIIYQYAGKYVYINAAITCVCLVIALIYNHNDNYIYNSILNVTLAYPIFVWGGELLRRLSQLSSMNWKRLVIMLIVSLLIIGITSHFNGSVRLYGGIFGNNLILFLLGSIAGIVAIYSFSLLIQNYRPKTLTILSAGTILILGFHNYFLIAYKLLFTDFRSPITDYFFSFVVLCAFVPIILFTSKYFPILLGMRRAK